MYSEKRMGHIGYETWNYAILANLGKLTQNQKQIRLRYEQYFIKKLQPKLNIKYNIAFRKEQRTEKKKQSYKIRTPTKASKGHNNITTYTITEIHKTPPNTLTTQCLDIMIPLLKHGHHYKITTQKRGYRLTNWDFVMNQIGSSQILPNGRGYTLEALRPKLETNKIKTLTLVCNKMNHMKNIHRPTS